DQTWGIQIERVIGRLHADDLWTYIAKSERGGVPFYGTLTGLSGIHSGRRLELLPYTLERLSYVAPGPAPFRSYPVISVSAAPVPTRSSRSSRAPTISPRAPAANGAAASRSWAAS